MAAGPRVDGIVVERRAQHFGFSRASRVGPHIYGRDWMTARVEPEETMPECRYADRPRVLGRVVGMDPVQARDDRLQKPLGVVLDAAVASESRRVLDLVGTPGDRPTMAVIERRARGGGADVQRDDH